MYCSSCGDVIEITDNFCVNCGLALKKSDSTASGDGSINIAGSNSITDSPIHVGDVYQDGKPEEIAYIDRIKKIPVMISGHQVKNSWITICGAFGFVGSCASIYSVLGTVWQFLFIVTLGFSFLILMLSAQLRRTRFVKMTWFNLEANPDGTIFTSKIGGDCPKCDGALKLVNKEVTKNYYKTYVRCSRNSDHIWSFDPTVLD